MSTGYSEFSIVNQLDTNPEYTVVLVGAALDGPSNIPFALNLDTDPYEALGQSPLADAYNAARLAGMEDIVAYRLNGSHATATLKDKTGKEIVNFTSVSASSIYNDIQMIAYPDHLFITATDGTSRAYFFSKYKAVADLVYAINRDAYYGLVEFGATSIDEYYQLMNLVDIPTDVIFTGGNEESEYINHRDPLGEVQTDPEVSVPLLKERLKVALFGEDPDDILDRQPNTELGAMQYGVITLCDMYHDDDPELTEILGSFCLNKTKEIGFGCIGVIGTKPIYSEILDMGEDSSFEDTIHNRVLELVSLSESLQDLEAYKYVQVIVGHTGYTDSQESSIPVSYAYAATQASLLYHSMMSNKALRGFGKLKFEISKEDIALLTANGYTCIVPSIRRGFVPFYATSFSKDKESVMAKPHNLRTSQYVSRMLVEELDSLIGSNYTTLSVKEAVEVARTRLEGMVADNVIRSYELNYELLEQNTVLNIEASLTPFSEIKAVSSIAVISFPKGVVA